MDYSELMKIAQDQRKSSYSPYSGFSVGAALLCDNGTVYTGCNIENSAFSPTVCAERVAFFKAVSDGIYNFKAIAIAGGKHGKDEENCAPCGVCRQVMAEFCSPEFKIVLVENGIIKIYALGDLLPKSFELK